MLDQFSEAVAKDIGTSLTKQGKFFDPISITLIIVSILYNLYKICKNINVDQARKPSILQRWTLKRIIKTTLKNHPNCECGQDIYTSLLKEGRGLNLETFERIKSDISTKLG